MGKLKINSSDTQATSRAGLVMLAWIFLIMSFVGLVGESLVSLVQDGFWKNRAGLLWGPFSPIYGLGAVIMTIVLGPLRNAPALILFAVAGVTGASFEWFASLFFEKAFGIVAWSYTGHPFNINGRTSLVMAAIWGILGVAWIKLALPPFERVIGRIPPRARTLGAAFICLFFVANAIFTLAAFNCWFERMSGSPAETPIQQFFATHYGDDFMANRFQTMSMWTHLANR